MNDDERLGAGRIRELLVELGQRLDDRGVSARLFLVGGAAMALGFNSRRATRDLDGVFEPKQEIYDEAEKMARKHGLPLDWLNDGVKGLLPDRVPTEVGSQFESRGISVGVASAEYLFAMKAAAAREDADAEDLRFLATHLGLTDATEALDLVERYISPHRLRPTSQFFVEAAFDDLGIASSPEPSRSAGTNYGRVRPYRRKDGTQVKGHHRHRP